MKKYLYLIVLALFAISCKDVATETEGGSLTVNPDELVFSATGGYEILNVKNSTGKTWTMTVSGDASWCTVDRTSGSAASVPVTVTVSGNDSGAERSTVLTISADGVKSVAVKVLQNVSMDVPVGISAEPSSLDADKPAKIYFKASSSSPLYGHNGEVYAHIGIVDGDVWNCVPADWNVNLDKCRMQSVDENVWALSLEPSIREWFASGELPIESLGIVIRNADGTKKGVENDTFIPVTDNKYLGFQPETPESQALPSGMEYGINVIDDATITFVLHDCDKKSEHRGYAYIIGDFNNWTLSNDNKSRMYRDDASGCWWITISGLDPSKEYRYQYYVGDFEGTHQRMADAFCEKILDPDNDRYIPSTTYDEDLTYPEKGVGIVSVVKTGKDNYAWEVTDFQVPEDLVIYEILLRDFSETKDINGAIAKLDYIQKLGVNAVELMPIQEFDGNNSWGYNPCFYFALDKAYGTPAMYKKFVDECHKRGIAVIVDVVYNHNTGNSPLAKLYWNSTKNEPAANNPYFNVSAPHPYNVFHDFNHENAFVKNLVKRSTAHLMEEYKVDGFRFDLTKGFTQRQCTESNAADYDAGRIAILKDYGAAIKSVKSDAVVILEHFCALSEEKELAEAGLKLWRNMNEAYSQAAMGWSEKSSFSGMYTGTSSMPFGSTVGFMESHDEERLSYKQLTYGADNIKINLEARMQRAGLSAFFALMVPGPKMIWQFGELGYDISIEYNDRTGEKPLHWEYLDVPERKELYDTYSEILKFRTDYPEFFEETADFSWKVNVSDWTAGRYITCTAGDKSFVAVGNFDTSDHQLWVDLPENGTWRDYFDSNVSLTVEDKRISTTVPKGKFRLFINF